MNNYFPTRLKPFSSLLLLCSFMTFIACGQSDPTGEDLKLIKQENAMLDNDQYEKATLGAGCFWCIEAVFQDIIGVQSVVSGYTGGEKPNPTYKDICTGQSGHAEVAQLVYDPEVISFEEILEIFWTTHDPTTLNRQGNDVGTQYRSAIFYHNEKQRQIGEKSMKEFAPTVWNDPIVTEISPLGDFYIAEDYHQNFYKLNPNYGYCRIIINPKIAKLKEKFAHKLK